MQLVKNTKLLVAAAALGLAISAIAADTPKDAVKFAPGDLKWKPSPVPGIERANMIGDDTKSGPYMFRTKFPPNFKLQAHSHPDERAYTIISGTWYIGWGTKFDESKLSPLPTGSFYTEPANVPHYVATKEDGAVIQITGTGPSKQIWVDPAHAPKK